MVTGDYEGGLRVAEEIVSYLKLNNNRYNQSINREYTALAVFYAGKYELAREMFQNIKLSTHPIETVPVFSRMILEGIDLQTGNYAAVLEDAAFAGRKMV
jgi:hypothetical protein